eukprot:CAMPEP_0178535876 /NCGR_PEP_ID=MMETSP0696-20121128/35783_1 /TAXON_ID=265572 /ORGANISM="Extubocellulus spinifer, Strain CCMP396" /LENGTH=363 /DNA_ID=CAMNT_0020168053 /DNA_START=104 /DNA_END=1192 /DNA_ORIENTATION=+
MEEEPFDSPNRPPPRPGAANLSSISEGRNETTIMSNTSSSGDDGPVISPAIPESYAHDPFAAEPILEHLRHLNADTASIQQLLHAADADVHLRAVLDNDPAIVQTYDPTTDEAYLERSERRRQNEDEIRRLDEECDAILRLLDVGPSRTQMTQSEVLQERLERWGRALELYVWLGGGGGGGEEIDLLTLLEKLCEGCSGEEELSEALSQASQMCTALVDETSVAVRDCTEDAADAEDAYHIRLEAHSILSRRAVQSAEAVEEQFRTNGRAALKIGQQLEMAEAKRRQCESAAVLIRRWWTMENLAEQEATSGEEIRVDEEVRGAIPSSAGRMDPLYTKPENGLEAAKALKMLRTVVKQRSSTP